MAWHVVVHTVDGSEHRLEPHPSEAAASTQMGNIATMCRNDGTAPDSLAVDYPQRGRKLLLPQGVAWLEIVNVARARAEVG